MLFANNKMYIFVHQMVQKNCKDFCQINLSLEKPCMTNNKNKWISGKFKIGGSVKFCNFTLQN